MTRLRLSLSKIIIFGLLLLIPSLSWAGIDFDGIDDDVNLGSATSLDNLGPLTISAWVNIDGIVNAAPGLVTKIVDVDNRLIFRFRDNDAGSPTNTIEFKVGYSGTDLSRTASDNVVVLGTWVHLLVTWDDSGTASNIKMYKNGTEVSYQSTTNATLTQGSDASANLKIGAGDAFADGTITEVAIWNMVLSASQIASLANSKIKGLPLQIQPASLVGYWPIDDQPVGTSADGDTVRDLSGNGNNGTGNNGANNTGLAWTFESWWRNFKFLIRKAGLIIRRLIIR